MNQTIGSWAFILGVLIAILAGIVIAALPGTAVYAGYITIILIVLGLIVGFLNINDKETQPFLIASIALMLVGGALSGLDILNLGDFLTTIVRNMAAFVAPAALLVSLKAIYKLAKAPTV